MDDYQQDFKNKIFLVGAIILILIGLVLVLFFLPKQSSQQGKKDNPLVEKNRIEKEIAQLKEEKSNLEKKSSEVSNQTEAKEDLEVEGVEIIKKEDKKIIKNTKQGYEIEVPSKMLIARTLTNKTLNLYLPDQKDFICCPGWPQCQADFEISVQENPNNISLEKWVKDKKTSYLKEGQGADFKELGFQKIGENNWYKAEIFVEGLFPVPTFYYALPGKEKIYEVFMIEWDEVFKDTCPHKLLPKETENFLTTFKLI